jgi:hypothetical protein
MVPLLVVINISICGDWAGAAYSGGGSCSDAVSNASNYDGVSISSLLFGLDGC